MKVIKPLALFCFFILSHASIFAESAGENQVSESSYKSQSFVKKHINFMNENFNLMMKCAHHRHHSSFCPHECRCEISPLGIAGFSVTDPQLWYTILTPNYPSTVLLSQNRNTGSTHGNIQLTPNGLLIGEAGNYSISFAAILQNLEDEYTAFIPVFVSLNGSLDPTQGTAGSVVALPTGFIGVAQGTGILENVEAGTTVSLIATNGGSPEPQPIQVVSWNISLFKIADDCCKNQTN